MSGSLQDLFAQARELPEIERAGFLAVVAAGDPDLAERLRRLLAAADEGGSPLDRTPWQQWDGDGEPLEEPPLPERIGPYRVLRELGRGGMGRVFLAEEETADFRRTVALKVIDRPVLDTDAVRRFRDEVRILASLEHPGIARFLDGGRTPDGTWFLALEHVEGEDILAHAKTRTLGVRERLELFLAAVDAVQCAHERGVVHRDIKPANLLVGRDGRPRLLDFGISKLADRDGADGAALTRTQSRVLTPAYASPEQFRGDPVTPGSDVYSLGVLLYELLADRRPFPAADSSAAALANAVLAIEPDPPSAAVRRQRTGSDASGAVDGSAPRRRSTGRTIDRDLDAICLRALRKEPAARYADAGALAADLRRYLAGEPVAARQGGWRYHALRSLRRHRGKLSAAVALLLSTGALVVAAIAYRRAELARQPPPASAAVEPLRLAVLPFENVGGDPDTKYLSEGLTNHLINRLSRLPGLAVIGRSSVARYEGKDVDVRQIGQELGVGAVVAGRVAQRPGGFTVVVEVTDARDRRQLWGATYERKSSELIATHQQLAAEVAERLRTQLNASDRALLTARDTADPEAYRLYLRGRYLSNERTAAALGKAIEYFQEAIARDPRYALAYAGLADVQSTMASAYNKRVAPRDARDPARKAALRAVELGPGTSEAHAALGQVLMQFEWDWTGAERELDRALELNPSNGAALHARSHLDLALRRFDASSADSLRALDLDPASVMLGIHLGEHYHLSRRPADAAEQYQKALELNPNHPNARPLLALVYEQQGKYPEAIAELERAAPFFEGTSRVRGPLGRLYGRVGRRREAQALLAELLRERAAGSYVAADDVAAIHLGLGDEDRAFEWLGRACEEHAAALVNLDVEPAFDSLRGDPRFAELLRCVGLPDPPAELTRAPGSSAGATSLAAHQAVAEAQGLYLAARYRDAIHRLERVVAEDARDAEAWALLGKSYARVIAASSLDTVAQAEYRQKALRAAVRAAELNPSLDEAQVALALANRMLERVDAWRAAARRAIELNPRLPEAHVLLGDSYAMTPTYTCSRQRDATLAEREYRRALDLDPRLLVGRANFAYHLVWNAREQDALALVDEGLAASPDELHLMRARATALTWLSRTDEAERQLLRIAGSAPTTVQDEWELAALELLRGHAEDAASRFSATVVRDPRPLRKIDTARIYCRAGRPGEAAAYLDQVFAADRSCATFVQMSPGFATCRQDPAIRTSLDRYLPPPSPVTARRRR